MAELKGKLCDLLVVLCSLCFSPFLETEFIGSVCETPTGRTFSLEFKFCYLGDYYSAKFKFRSCNVSYIMNFKIKNLLIFQSVNLSILGQVAKLNTVCILIL